MRNTFHLKTLTVAVAALSITSIASAAGLDRSGQDVTAFLQDGTYAEAVYTYIDADVTGNDVSGNKIGDIAESYDFFRYGVKADVNETFSVGILYDEPFGAAADYSGDNNFVDQNTASPRNGEGTNVEVRTESITGIVGAKFGENKNFQVYGGPVAQRVEADVKLRGTAYSAANGYTTHISTDQEYGYIAGVAYSKPEIALKAALTYRSEIEHTADAAESYPAVASFPGFGPRTGDIDITTPESVNFDFQTGINPTTLVTAKVRWVPWSDFSIVPSLYNDVSKLNTAYQPDGLPLVSYDEDQWVVELGLAKRLAPALAVSGTVGWDSGAGNPVTSLGPTEGYYSAGLGAKYNVTENWAISAGGKYLWLGDADGQVPTGNTVANFEDNDGFVLGVKVSYQAL
ncbi:outer membrane protein transport protein [Psychrobacter sp. TB55-MNA-CIBAN-0194]|uniref:OmpP1/FadL family transporter n=1 Tax=Psychrobacter sp. TB55-MNA-CIBAN-0194 TaxID=3140445 RepID=UPI0033180257